MASRMIEKFDKYWSNIHVIMGVAALLNPRCKMALIIYYYKLIYGNDFESEVRKVVEMSRPLFREYQRRVEKPQDEEPQMERKQGGDLPIGFQKFVHTMKKMKFNNITELELYLEEALLPSGAEKFDVLAWWKPNAAKFPTLGIIAKDIYVIPVSTVASESAFSMDGQIVSPQRNRFHPSLVEALAYAQNWLRTEFEDLSNRNPFKTYCDDIDESEDVIEK